jgi:hypothetical protein
MEIDFNKVICLDVMKYNDETILEMANHFGLNGSVLCDNKKKGIKKYYIYTELIDNTKGLDPVIAFEVKAKSLANDTFYTYENIKLNATLSRKQIEKMKKVKSFDFISFKKEKKSKKSKVSKVNLDIDSILDKISKFGLSSLTSKEKNFLDNFS